MQVIKLSPPPAWPASRRRGRSHRGLPWSGRSLARLCLVYTSSPGAVRSVFVQPVTVFIQTFIRSVLLFNLQQFLYKRFFGQFFCSTCNIFYTNVLFRSSRTKSSWTTIVWKKPGRPPLPGLHLKPGCCSVSSFVQPVTVFIQTFIRSVLLFNLQFLYKRFFGQFFCSTCNSFSTNVLFRSSSSCLAPASCLALLSLAHLLPGLRLRPAASCLARRPPPACYQLV